MDNNTHPGWAFFDLLLFGLTFFAGYKYGSNKEILNNKFSAYDREMEKLRRELKELNRNNEINRKKIASA